MENKKRLYLMLFGVFAVVFVTLGASYAFFQYTRTGDINVIKTGNIEFAMLDGNNVSITDEFPESDTEGNKNEAYTFTVKNTSSVGTNLTYNVSLLTDNNDSSVDYFNNSQIKFNLVKNGVYVASTGASLGRKLSTIDGFNATAINGDGVVLENQIIEAQTTDTYSLRIWISDDVKYSPDGESPTELVVGTYNSYQYSLKVRVNASDTVTNGSNQNQKAATLNLKNISSSVKSRITELYVLNQLPVDLYAMEDINNISGITRLSNVVKLADEDDGNSKFFYLLDDSEDIIAWYTYEDGSYVRVDENKNPMDTSSNLKLYIYSDQQIELPMNSSYLFSDFVSLERISSFDKFDTSKVTDMSSMFYNCNNLLSLSGIGDWDTSNVTNMSNMFECCDSLSDISDISGWNVSNVADMESMFLQTVVYDFSVISSWDVSSVQNMEVIFNGTNVTTYPTWYNVS